MKECTKCKKEKNISEFRKVGKYHRNTCKRCETDETLAGQKITFAYIQSFKKECCICGYKKCKNALDFHHINADEKDYLLSRLRVRKWSEVTKQLIDAEMNKCIVVCANCHREIHETKHGE